MGVLMLFSECVYLIHTLLDKCGCIQ